VKVISVKSRAHRILKDLRSYSSAVSDLETFASRIGATSGRELLGVYLNPPSTTVQAVVISSDALHLITKDEVTTLPFAAIKGIEGPPEKADASAVNIQLKDGGSRLVPILGGHDRFRDVFPFMTFLDRVVADQNQSG
jgi:hypothetical protein